MAKAGLLEQNRLSGANRNTLIAGGIMANTAEIFNFPVPDAAQKEPRVADLDDGYTRIANELLEAVMLAGLTQHQLLVFLAVMRKTYGFNKKLDWVSNEQLSELTGILPHKCSAAKSVLVKRGILIQSGRNIGINNVVSEWSTLPESGKKNKVYLKEVNLPESGKKSLPKSGIAPNQRNGEGNRRITGDFYPAFLFYGVRRGAKRRRSHHRGASGGSGWRLAPRNNFMVETLEKNRSWTRYFLARELRKSLKPERRHR